MKKGTLRKLSIYVSVALILCILSLSLGISPAQAAPKEKPSVEQKAEDTTPKDTIDSSAISKDAFPNTEDVSHEDQLSIKDPYSKNRENPDGTFTKDIYFSPINWQNSDGTWQEIDNNIVGDNTGGYAYANASNAIKIRLAKQTGQGKTMELDLGKGKKVKIDFSGGGKPKYDGKGKKGGQTVIDGKPSTTKEAPTLDKTPNIPCVSDKNEAWYLNPAKGYSVEFTLESSSIEQLIKLENSDAPNTFDFKLDLEGMDVNKDEMGNLHFLNREDQRELFEIFAPMMYDSSMDPVTGEPASSHEVSMDITKDKKGKAHLTIAADPSWLSDPSRVYPVSIDPSWTSIYSDYLTQSTKYMHGDAYVKEDQPTTNFGAAYYLQCARASNGHSRSVSIVGFDVRSFFHNSFCPMMSDPSNYNYGANILSSAFILYCQNSTSTTSLPVKLYYGTSGWSEDTVTWNGFPQHTYLASGTATKSQNATFNVTGLTQEWVRGEENGGMMNAGLALYPGDSMVGTLQFSSYENGYAYPKPYLSVIYTLLGSTYNTDEVPKTFVKGETKNCSVYVKNTGEETWSRTSSNPVKLGYYIKDQNGTKVTEGRAILPRDVKPNDAISLGLPITAPSTAGTYKLYISMVKENEYWFDSRGVNPATMDIPVIEPSGLPQDQERVDSSRLGVGWTGSAGLGAFSANLLTGNATASATDLSVSGRGVPFGLSRTYNSGAPADQSTLFGPNWFSNLDAKIKDYGNGYIGYWTGGGTSYLLVKSNKVSDTVDTYVCPEGAYFKVEVNTYVYGAYDPNGPDWANWKYRVIHTSGAVENFDDLGRFIYWSDGTANKTDPYYGLIKTKIRYNFDGNGNIQATDASGRTFTILLNTEGMIDSVSEDASWAAQEGHEPRTVSYVYGGPGGRLSRVTLDPGDHWSEITYSDSDPNLIVQTEAKLDVVDGQTKTAKSYYEYSGGKLVACRDARSASSTDDTYKSSISYFSGYAVASSPTTSTYVTGASSVIMSAKFVLDAQGHITSKITGTDPSGNGGLGRIDYAWNTCHQNTLVTNYSSLSPLTVLGSTTCIYDGKGNATRVESDVDGTGPAVATADYTASNNCAANPTTSTGPDGDTVNSSYTPSNTYLKSVDAYGAQATVLRDPTNENVVSSETLNSNYINPLWNPSFEQGTDPVAYGWSYSGEVNGRTYSVQTVTDGSAPAGKRFQRLSVSGNTNTGSTYVYAQVAVSASTDYTLAFSYRNNACANQVNAIIIRQYNSSMVQVGTDKVISPFRYTDWNRISASFKTEATAAYTRVFLRTLITATNATAYTDFDAVQIYQGTRDTAFNHVENANFERALSSDNWSVSGTNVALSTETYVTPGNSLKITGSGNASQTINVKANTKYLLSGYVYSENGANIYYNLGSGDVSVKTNGADGYINGTDSLGYGYMFKWFRVYTVIDTGSAQSIVIKPKVSATNQWDYAYFDDIQFTAMPDNASTNYDTRGNYAVQATNPLGNTSYAKYDPIGNLTEARDARSSSSADNTYCFSYSYNELNQINSVISPLVKDALGNPIQSYTAGYNYDESGRMTSFSDYEEKSSSLEYNDLSQPVSKNDPLDRQGTTEYNEAGGIKKMVSPNGWEFYYSYRSDGKLDKVAFKDPATGLVSVPYTFVCDAAGRVTSVSDTSENIALNYTYDKASRLTTSTDNYAGGFTASYGYSKGGNLLSLQQSKSGWGTNATVSYAYRDTGELSTITLPTSPARSFSYIYDDRGRLSTQYIPDATSSNNYSSTILSYDAAGRPATIANSAQGGGYLTKYTYDPVGNITRAVTSSSNSVTKDDSYTYDELCRLVSWTDLSGKVTRYFYDGNGNIAQVKENSDVTEAYTYDDANQILTGPRGPYSYEANGNLTGAEGWTYSYDRGSRLVGASNTSSNIRLEFHYDANGLRISKKAFNLGNGQQQYATYYHYDQGGNILCETDGSGNVIRSYAYDPAGHPLAFTQNVGGTVQTFFLHTNAHGDVTYVSNQNGLGVKFYSYDPWGKLLNETSSTGYESLKCPYTYAGYYSDADTGLYYMKARYYSPTLKRFLTKDPNSGSKANPSSLNPYAYCLNNPVVLADPSGQTPDNPYGCASSFDFSCLDGMRASIAAACASIDAANAKIASACAAIAVGARACAAAARACAAIQISISAMNFNFNFNIFPNGFSVHVGSCGMSQIASFASQMGAFASSVSDYANGVDADNAAREAQRAQDSIDIANIRAQRASELAAARAAGDPSPSFLSQAWNTICNNPAQIGAIVIGTVAVIAGGVTLDPVLAGLGAETIFAGATSIK